jgi:TolB protein
MIRHRRFWTILLGNLLIVAGLGLLAWEVGHGGEPREGGPARVPAHALAQRTRADGAELLYAPAAPASAQNPAFSPDGTTLLFTLFHQGYNYGPAGLYTLALASGQVAPLLDEPNSDAVNIPGSSWNARLNRITFASDRADGLTEIWTIGPNGNGLFRVTNHTALGDRYSFLEPSFSPDGEWLVLEVSQELGRRERQGSLYKARSNGTDLVRLTGAARDAPDDRLPNWSPTGERILFQRREADSDDWNIYTLAPDGSAVRQVTTGPWPDTDASWSPDGRWIVYSSDHGGLLRPNLFVIAAEGGEPIRVTFTDEYEDAAPSWSPDGRWIAFESRRGEGGRAPAALWRVPAPPQTVR